MSVQRIIRGETLRYRARVKSHGREVATRVFERKRDAVAWEQEQRRALRSGEWSTHVAGASRYRRSTRSGSGGAAR